VPTSEPHILWRNARIATCDEHARVFVRGALMTRGEHIEWIGDEAALPAAPEGQPYETRDLGGAWITPGLIDCHTHLVFAGTRANEYAERLRGTSYEEIAQRGGGILSTVRAVRAASEQQLLDESAPRLESLLREGLTCVEIKSGYGLTCADEAKMLRVARRLAQDHPVSVRTTCLAAHTVPPEFRGRADEYVDTVATQWLPRLHAEGLVDAVDIFCERIAFDTAQARRLFEAARRLGIPVKAHAEQLANIGATRLATEFGALSCDHLEYAEAEDVRALAQGGTVAVVLPVAFYSLAAARRPPIAQLRAAKARLAIGSDCNPGSAPGASLLLAASMATRLFGLTTDEALRGMTLHAAQALGLAAERGSLTRGLAADFTVWDVESLDEFGYWSGFNRCRGVVRRGRLVHGRVAKG
jgi:imidazolonepropionase